MASLKLRLLTKCLPLVRHRVDRISKIKTQTEAFEAVKKYQSYAKSTKSWFNPNSVSSVKKSDGSRWIHRNGPGLIIYFHGGGFMIGSPSTVLPITNHLSSNSLSSVCSVKYPLFHSYEETVSHCIETYERVCNSVPHDDVILAGDSAGGHLALTVALNSSIKASGLLLLSPWTDIGGSLATDTDPLISRGSVIRGSKLIFGDQVPPPLAEHPNLNQLPPIYLQYGQTEVLAEENRKFAEAVNGQVIVDEIPHVFHGFHYFSMYLVEAQVALDRAALFVRNCINQNPKNN